MLKIRLFDKNIVAMKNINIAARIKRNMLDQLSGKYYRDKNSDIIRHLNSDKRNAIVGIQQEDGIYTIIGDEKIYYKTLSGAEGEILIGDFLKILNETTLRLGKKVEYEFIKVNEWESVWVMNTQTMLALWNTMLLLYDE